MAADLDERCDECGGRAAACRHLGHRRPNDRHVLWHPDDLAARAALTSAPADPFQPRVKPWLLECFGEQIASDREERNHRFLEEALELVQACGCTRIEAHQLVDYVFDRPVGEKVQEVGGVMVTLAALCLAHDIDMHAEGETELARIGVPSIVAKIRAKQAAKPKHSPLPAEPPAAAGAIDAREQEELSDDDLREAANDFGHFEGEDGTWHFAESSLFRLLREFNALASREDAPAAAGAAQAVAWRDMATAPKDGTLLRLLVEFEHHATEDGEGPQPTIGSNTWDNHHDFDEWQFAGWNWEQDCYTQGIGKPVSWLPMFDTAPGVAITTLTNDSFAADWLTNRAPLNPLTVNLVVRFARALAAKLAAAEEKYGYSDGWISPDWMDECRAKLLEHIAKGDPRDVAAYCAFLWHHGENTASSAEAFTSKGGA